jgi:FMN reductase
MIKRIVVVSAGLSVPSSTRLLADRLAEAAAAAVESRGTEVEIEVVELRPLTRWPTTC